jgi:hypothetical protein
MDRRRRRLFVECVPKVQQQELGGYCGAGSNRTKIQCMNRWHSALNSIDRTAAQTGIWTPAEDESVEEAVEKFHGKNWDIAEIVRVERETVCGRWRYVLDASIILVCGENQDLYLKSNIGAFPTNYLLFYYKRHAGTHMSMYMYMCIYTYLILSYKCYT